MAPQDLLENKLKEAAAALACGTCLFTGESPKAECSVYTLYMAFTAEPRLRSTGMDKCEEHSF